MPAIRRQGRRQSNSRMAGPYPSNPSTITISAFATP
jgi:hypothetical protein